MGFSNGRYVSKSVLAVALVALLNFTSPALGAGNGRGSCAADLDGDGTVAFGDLLVLLSSWGPCDACAADIDGDGTVAFGDLLNFLASWGPCPGACDFEDVRVEIEDAADDPPDIQRNYDAINRTSQLFRDIPFEQWFNSDFAGCRPLVQARLDSLEDCTGLLTDVAAISGILDELELVSAGVPIRAIITAIPGELEEIKTVLDQFRVNGFGFPPSAFSALDGIAKGQTIDLLLAEVPNFTYRDFYWIDPELVTDAGVEAIELAKQTRVIKYTSIDPDSGDVFGICDNDRCCHKYEISDIEINDCNPEDDLFCKKRIDGNLCRVSADDCPDD